MGTDRTETTMRRGRRRAIRGLGAIAALALATSACEGVVVDRINEQRTAQGRAELPVAAYLTEATRAHSSAMCAAGETQPSPDPAVTYGGETAVALDELVGSALLDPDISDPAQRNSAATDAVWAQWQSDPSLVDARWDELGVGEVECPDGRLYMSAALRENPSMPPSGRYVTAVYPADQIQVLTGLEYGEAVNYQGVVVVLLLDLYLPPAGPDPERPLIVMVHGGGFSGGSRANLAANALEYARRGFVAASIDYRLRPNDTPEEQLVAALDAIDDAMESVRWFKSQAATYGIDAARIALLGTSAGGAIALGVAVAEDPTPGGPLAAFSPRIGAGVSTGAHLTPGLGLIDLQPTDSPVMMFHFEQDTSRGQATWDYAYQTCAAIHAAGNVCDSIRLPGAGHTVALGPTGKWWVPEIGPFLWYHLDLSA
jgi:pimeloyl-ACP methyl ester carboxylesterase